jgi:hypothetical protein
MAPAVVLSCAVANQLVVPGVPFPLVPSSAGLWRVDEAAGAVQVPAQPHFKGAEGFVEVIGLRARPYSL